MFYDLVSTMAVIMVVKHLYGFKITSQSALNMSYKHGKLLMENVLAITWCVSNLLTVQRALQPLTHLNIDTHTCTGGRDY